MGGFLGGVGGLKNNPKKTFVFPKVFPFKGTPQRAKKSGGGGGDGGRWGGGKKKGESGEGGGGVRKKERGKKGKGGGWEWGGKRRAMIKTSLYNIILNNFMFCLIFIIYDDTEY